MSVFSLVSGGGSARRRAGGCFSTIAMDGKAREYYDKAAKERQNENRPDCSGKVTGKNGDARDAAGKALDVSGRKR